MKLLSASLATLMSSSLLLSVIPTCVSAADESDPVIVVSLGDSYSSGEGIEPFYYQWQDVSDKIYNENWLAHRSEKSWPSQLVIPGISGSTGDYDVINNKDTEECKWYFKAVSGAETKHFDLEEQDKSKEVFKMKRHLLYDEYFQNENAKLPLQLSVFDDIPENTVDYVTMSVGGNDVDFTKIVTTCALKSTHIHFINDDNKAIKKEMKALWESFDTTKANLKRVYTAVSSKAGSEATVIVAGYPKLFDKTGKGVLISEEEATVVNENVTKFNEKLKELVSECRQEGYSIYFVDVENEFDGHEAYTHSKKASKDGCWINPIWLSKRAEDLSDISFPPGSAYSMHPNEYGAQAYAKCVNNVIAELGTLSGKVVKASDRLSPINEAIVTIYQNGIKYATTKTDLSGNYQMRLPEGEYKVVITADGYIDFDAYTSITRQNINYMETFLMVEGSGDSIGTASGKVYDGLTGKGISDVTLTIRKGWNTSESENKIDLMITTNSNGFYTVELPFGNYTVYPSKEGYISSSFNIISQEGTTNEQNGTMSSGISGDGYRIILTWGENPIDLDSHVVGKLSNGASFHTYFSNMSHHDGNIEVCNLDVDDTTSYGPETITLNPTTTSAYYYYIYKYWGSGTVSSSGAQIKLYQGNTLLNIFNVPTNLGESDYWNVFAIKNGEVIVKNTITTIKDINYAE